MKVLIAGLATETNTFSPLATGLKTFEEGGIYHGDATAHPIDYPTGPLHIWRKLAEDDGLEVVESLSAFAQPAGTTVRAVYEALRDEILRDVDQAKPDIVLFALHGAMIADGYEDCEGDLIARTREILPEAAIGGLLDPHCHLTEAMLTKATALIAFKEYPHVDVPQRAPELYRICVDAAQGRVRPVMRDFDCRMIQAMPTPDGAMRAFVDEMTAWEDTPGVLSLSLAHGFPWGDHPRTGVRAFAVTDGDPALADQMARRVGERIFALREDVGVAFIPIAEAIDSALAEPEGPVVLADVSDNPGGGAPSDSTFLLRALLDKGVTNAASGLYWDPIALRMCQEAGEGARLALRLGGKMGPMSGDPLDLDAKVNKLASGLTQRFGDLPVSLGDCAWITAEGIDIVVNDLRGQTFHPEAFTGLGIPLTERQIVCVKSSNHFRAGFAPVASTMIAVNTPGAISPDFANIPFKRRARDYYPAVEDPFS